MPRPTSLNIVLNGVAKSVPVADGSEPLLLVLRNKLDQIGPKIGCGAEADLGLHLPLVGVEDVAAALSRGIAFAGDEMVDLAQHEMVLESAV